MKTPFTAVDTNILLYALNADAPENAAARAFLHARAADPNTVISELVLVELYVLLRNPAVVKHPLDPQQAVKWVQQFRRHPVWQLVDHDADAMDGVWRAAARPAFARTRIFDARLALSLIRRGVTHFATRNTAHFQPFGFDKVWDPLI